MSDQSARHELSDRPAVQQRAATHVTVRDDEACWLCGAPTVYRKCKIICTVCGFMRDCSDP